MKKGMIIALIVAAALILVGGMIVVLGLSFATDPQADPVTMLMEREHSISETFDSVLVDTEDCNVDFVVFEGTADPHVIVKERESTRHSVTVEDGILKIKMIDSRKWRDHIGISWESMEMTVYLPRKQYENVRVTTDTGRIRIPEVFSARELALRSDTGRVVCDAKVSEDLSCFTDTGSITVRGAGPAKMRLVSNTGNITLSGMTGKEIGLQNNTGRTEVEDVNCEVLACESNTGDVVLRGVLADRLLQIDTDTGDVRIEDCDAGNTNIETDTGDVSGHFLTPKWFSANSDTGKVTVPNTPEGNDCRIETDTGDIHFE